MRLRRLKRVLIIVLAAWMLLSSASAQEITLRQYMENNLTEVFGYTVEELEDFIFEAREDGSIACWPKDHPSWVYTAFHNDEYGSLDGTTPFYTGYTGYCGEGAVRELLKNMWEKHWISAWSEETKAALLDACLEANVRISTELYLAESAAQGLQYFFESCYGPMAGWTEQLFDLRDVTFSEYGLTVEDMPFHVPGVRRFSRKRTYQTEVLRTYTLFDGGEYPDELKEAFSDPHLAGWVCQSGALCFDENTQNRGQSEGDGLAAFEKDGRRQLTQLVYQQGQWTVYPIGTNALYPTGDYRIIFDSQQPSFAIQYRLNDDETAAFYVMPEHVKSDKENRIRCKLCNYERVNQKNGEAVWISLNDRNMPTWQKELTPNDVPYPVVQFPDSLGVMPIAEFPTTLEAAWQYTFPGIPEGYAFSLGVNLRTQRSSRSASHGILNAGTLLPELERLPGDPNEWIRTKVGFLEGFVTDTYVSLRMNALPVVEAQKEISLKKGTGFFDSTIRTLPAGTQMHVIIDNGDWLYVDVPQSDIRFLMDVKGTFGYVRKAEVCFLPTPAGLNWED